ncbi:hypothetical protein [Maribacter sp. HTCC2170]|uniref:hypothetical protein n=1 Tax=Maribacter sp. (strain HTCC2170 / KCCM 42371) TaxID=313603 RepID=UPI00006BD39C|nr:hypothetical protein [Maribacter sp. HTCC2170]EAR02781.1 hypothetical protein FB2170_05820 [Maribacter sp. HTCC2170]
MAENNSSNSTSNDEIDLGQLFALLGNGFRNVFHAFLRVFSYFKKRALVMFILVVVGLAVGYGLNQIISKKLRTQVIVKPNLESKEYLYDVIGEIQSNIKARDVVFFSALDIDVDDLKGFEISITPVENQTNIETDLKYLELLEKFQGSEVVSDVVRSEILNKSSLNHRITFSYLNAEKGEKFSKKLINYVNSNSYFNELVSVNIENAKNRIKKNESLVNQIDHLILNYSKTIGAGNNNAEGRIVLDNEEKMDITGLLKLKNELIRDTENKKLELQTKKQAISIINFGKTHQVQKSFFGKNIVLIPSIMLSIYFLFLFLKYLNKKAFELQQ